MINRKLIRKTLREVGAKMDVDFLRKVRDRVHARIEANGDSAFICCAAQDVHGGDYTKSIPMRDLMDKFIVAAGGIDGGTMYDIGYAVHSKWDEDHADHIVNSNAIRKVVLQEMIDMNRSRKGTKHSTVDRKRIREALKNTQYKFPVDYLRKVRDLFNERAVSDSDAFLCWAAQDISKSYLEYRNEETKMRYCMNDFIEQFAPGRTVMNVVARHVDSTYSYDEEGKHPTNLTRAVVLQELIDMNRNRKGNRAKPTKE